MVDGHVRHGDVEVLFLLVERDFNSTEVDLQSGDVLLLFHDNLLLLGTETGLLLLKLDLSLTRLLFALTVLLLFCIVLSLLFFNGNGLRLPVPVDLRLFVLSELLEFVIRIIFLDISFSVHDLLISNGSIRAVNFQLKIVVIFLSFF